MTQAPPSNPPGATASNSPFRTRLFRSPPPTTESHPSPSILTTANSSTVSGDNRSWDHFPVSFRTGTFRERIEVVGDDETLFRFLDAEFSLRRLDAIYSKLWRVGYPRPPRPLTTQVELGRTIVLTHALDMHLVWGGGKIFLKPLPRYLLEPEFWIQNVPPPRPDASAGGDGQVAGQSAAEKSPATATAASASGPVRSTSDSSPSSSRSCIRKSALGLLYTYACLITHPADLKLALEHGLMPKDGETPPDWATWRKLASELLHPDITSQIHRRFRHSELRVDRLNWIYIFRDMPAFQMYHNPWHNYTDFLVGNLAWITTATVYIAVVLTAMQVGLSTNALKNDEVFHRASYGFAIFAILSPIIAVGIVLLALLVALIANWVNARAANRSSEPPSAAVTTSAEARKRATPPETPLPEWTGLVDTETGLNRLGAVCSIAE
ncbi:hypothetical protein DL768_003936 [Monosporascus sp. mg162]|nr:hypothetical protein DL768_003936 [Monosporascus sp. mg162]